MAKPRAPENTPVRKLHEALASRIGGDFQLIRVKPGVIEIIITHCIIPLGQVAELIIGAVGTSAVAESPNIGQIVLRAGDDPPPGVALRLGDGINSIVIVGLIGRPADIVARDAMQVTGVGATAHVVGSFIPFV